MLLQGSLLDASADPSEPDRLHLRGGAWVDHAPGWLAGSDEIFAVLARDLHWEQRRMWMYQREVDQPRLSAALDLDRLPVAVAARFAGIRRDLEARYGHPLGSSWVNLYRGGADSVAWHGDRHARTRVGSSLVAIVSLGERRPFLLRPAGGGASVRFALGRGDLLVMGGTCQRTWEHTVPKVAVAAPRISVTWRWPVDDVPSGAVAANRPIAPGRGVSAH